MTRVLVVGGGFTGLFASLLAAERGAEATLVAQGRGGLALSHGCIDVWGRSTPTRALPQLNHPHPYHLTGADKLRAALDLLQRWFQEADYPLSGSLSANLRLPTAAGSVHATTFAPRSLAQGHLGRGTSITLAEFEHLRDFYPGLVAQNLRKAGIPIEDILSLPLPNAPALRAAYASDLALLFDDPLWRRESAKIWKPYLAQVDRLGVPAVLGYRLPGEVLEDLEAKLEVTLFEIPTLPPSIPGLRIERILRRRLLNAGVQLIEGSRAIGRVDGRKDGQRAAGVMLATVGGPMVIDADKVILATGGMAHGGLLAEQNGRVYESVFDLPVDHSQGREAWTAPSPFEPQPYDKFGLRVDKNMQPLGGNGKPIFTNVYAAGGVLTGADRLGEGSRQGIDLATAFCAVESALA